MGACDFYTPFEGSDAKDAFAEAVDDAVYMHGNEGYSGTIAEKRSFVMISLPEGRDPYAYADELLEEGDDRVTDKWGPAGCIDLGEGKYLFFGLASS